MEKSVLIKDLSTHQKNINITLIILYKLESNKTKDNNTVITYVGADESGSIEVSLWDIELIPGDIIYMHDSYTSIFKDKKRLFVSGNGYVRRLGGFNKLFSVNEEHRKKFDEIYK